MEENKKICPECKGTGQCRQCRGTGKIPGGGMCQQCEHRGNGRCHRCHGKGNLD